MLTSNMLLLLFVASSSILSVRAFGNYAKIPSNACVIRNSCYMPRERTSSTWMLSSVEGYDDSLEMEMEPEPEPKKTPSLTNMEKAWRYVKKPYLSIGSKGAGPSHGNSLRQLLDQHSVVKVKINTYKLGTLEEAFNVLRVLAETSGAPEGIELLQWRNSANTIMFGKPGMTEQIEKGLYPPPRKPRGSEQELE